jgi:hypothetical protein
MASGPASAAPVGRSSDHEVLHTEPLLLGDGILLAPHYRPACVMSSAGEGGLVVVQSTADPSARPRTVAHSLVRAAQEHTPASQSALECGQAVEVYVGYVWIGGTLAGPGADGRWTVVLPTPVQVQHAITSITTGAEYIRRLHAPYPTASSPRVKA